MKSGAMPLIIVPKPQRAIPLPTPPTQIALPLTDGNGKYSMRCSGIKEELAESASIQPPKLPFNFKPCQLEQLNRLMVSLSREVVGLNAKLLDIEMRMAGLESRDTESDQPKKKTRRRACDIQKNFKCYYPDCAKSYGSEISLNLHIKLKHRNKLSNSDSAGNSKGQELEASMTPEQQDCSDAKNNISQ